MERSKGKCSGFDGSITVRIRNSYRNTNYPPWIENSFNCLFCVRKPALSGRLKTLYHFYTLSSDFLIQCLPFLFFSLKNITDCKAYFDIFQQLIQFFVERKCYIFVDVIVNCVASKSRWLPLSSKWSTSFPGESEP